MFSHYFEQIKGVSSYPIFSLIVFFLFFIGLGWYVFKFDKNLQNYVEKLPLED